MNNRCHPASGEIETKGHCREVHARSKRLLAAYLLCCARRIGEMFTRIHACDGNKRNSRGAHINYYYFRCRSTGAVDILSILRTDTVCGGGRLRAGTENRRFSNARVQYNARRPYVRAWIMREKKWIENTTTTSKRLYTNIPPFIVTVRIRRDGVCDLRALTNREIVGIRAALHVRKPNTREIVRNHSRHTKHVKSNRVVGRPNNSGIRTTKCRSRYSKNAKC